MKQVFAATVLIAVLTAVSASSKVEAQGVQCWYCELGVFCVRKTFQGVPGYLSCNETQGGCVVSGICPLTVAGPAGIDAAGAAVPACSDLVPLAGDIVNSGNRWPSKEIVI
jgi:hypothetical protein